MKVKVYVRSMCHKCHGSGEMECSVCGGSGYSWSGGQCYHCYGEGTETCKECNGDGYIEEEEEDHDM